MFRSRNFTEWMHFFICQALVYSLAFQSFSPAFAASTTYQEPDKTKQIDSTPATQTGGGKGPPPTGGVPIMTFFGPRYVPNRGNRPNAGDNEDRFYTENGRHYYGGDLYREGGSPWGTDIALAYSNDYMTLRESTDPSKPGLQSIWGALKDRHGFIKIVCLDNEGHVTSGRLIPPAKSGRATGYPVWVGRSGQVINPDRYVDEHRSWFQRQWDGMTNNRREYGGNDLYRRDVHTNQGIFDAYFAWDNRWPSVMRGRAQINSVIRDADGNPVMRLERMEKDFDGNPRKIVKTGILNSEGEIEVKDVSLDAIFNDTQFTEEEKKAIADEGLERNNVMAQERTKPTGEYIYLGKPHRAGDFANNATLPNGETVRMYFFGDPRFRNSTSFPGKLMRALAPGGGPVVVGHDHNGALVIGYIKETEKLSYPVHKKFSSVKVEQEQSIVLDQSAILVSDLQTIINWDARGRAADGNDVHVTYEAAERLYEKDARDREKAAKAAQANPPTQTPPPQTPSASQTSTGRTPPEGFRVMKALTKPAPPVSQVAPEDEPFSPENIDRTMGPELKEQIDQIRTIFTQKSLADIGRATARSVGRTSVQIGAGALVFYAAVYETALWSSHDKDPMALADVKSNTAAIMMQIAGFSLIAAPLFKQLDTGTNIPNSVGKIFKWNMLGMLVGSLGLQSIQLMARDPNFIKLKDSGFTDMEAWQHLWDRWNGRFLLENFGPAIIHNITTVTAVVTGSMALRWATPNMIRLAGAKIASNKAGALVLSVGLVIAGTIVYIEAYQLSEYLIRADRYFKNEFLSHGAYEDETDGANISDAQDAFQTEWQFLKMINFRPFNSQVIKEEPHKSDSTEHDFSFDTMARIMYHYDDKMHEWRQKQLAEANETYNSWMRKVTNFNLTRKFIYEGYNEAVQMIFAEKTNQQTEERFDNAWVDKNANGEAAFLAQTKLNSIMELAPPTTAIGYAGTKSFVDYMLASMACGAEAEKDVVDIRGYRDQFLDWFNTKTVGGWNSVGNGKSQMMIDPAGEAMLFHAPRITKEDPSNDSICNRRFVDGGNSYSDALPARSFMFLDTNITDEGLRKKMPTAWVEPKSNRRYVSLLEYIRNNIRDTILTPDGQNRFHEWWQNHIEKFVPAMEQKLQKDYQTGVLKTLVKALVSQEDWCYSGTRMQLHSNPNERLFTNEYWQGLQDWYSGKSKVHPNDSVPNKGGLFALSAPRVNIDSWPTSATLSGRCKDPSQRYLAVGILNSIRDEFEVYMQFMFDALTDGEKENAAMSEADQKKLAGLAMAYRQAFHALSDPSLFTVHETDEQMEQNKRRYEAYGAQFTKVHNEIKQFIVQAQQPTPESVAAQEAAAEASKSLGKKPNTKPAVAKPVAPAKSESAPSTTLYKRKLALTSMKIIAGLVGEMNNYIYGILNRPLVDPEKPTPSAEEVLKQVSAQSAPKPAPPKAQNNSQNGAKAKEK